MAKSVAKACGLPCLIPASCDSSFSAANLKGNVFGYNIYSPSVIVIAFIPQGAHTNYVTVCILNL